jgi:hypothetical protein
LNLLVTTIISSSLVKGEICIELGRGRELLFWCWVEKAVGGPLEPEGVVDRVPEGVVDREVLKANMEFGRLILEDPGSMFG